MQSDRDAQGGPGRGLGEAALFALGFHVLAWLYLRLSPARFFGSIGPDPGDPLFNLAILRWVAERATHAFSGLWDPTFFFPIPGVLALSDHLIGPSLLFGILQLVGLPPAGGYNALLLLALGGSAATAFWVFRQSGLTRTGAALGAILWSFSAFRWTALSHIQMLFAPFVPLTLWTFDRLLARPARNTALAFCLAYLGSSLGGSYLAYMIHFPLLVLLAVRLRAQAVAFSSRPSRAWLALSATFALATTALAFAPYLRIGKSLGLRPKLSDLSGFMVTTRSFFEVGHRTLYAGLLPEGLTAQRGLWLGVVIAALGAFGIWTYLSRGLTWTRRRWLEAIAILGVVVVALAASDLRFLSGGLDGATAQRGARHVFRATILVVVLALAWASRRRAKAVFPASDPRPEELWWKGLLWGGVWTLLLAHVAFFTILRTFVPGLEAVRDPGRFMTFASFSLAAFAARGAQELIAARPSFATASRVVLLLAALVEGIPRAQFLDWRPVAQPDELPAEYRWIQASPSVRAVLELPFLETWREAERMYLWSIHRRAIVNGYSGYIPRQYVQLTREIGEFPEESAVARLRELGVSHVVVHVDELTRVGRKRWNRWRSRLDARPMPWLKRVWEEESAEIYEIPAAAPQPPISTSTR